MVTMQEQASAIVTLLSDMDADQFARYVRTLGIVGSSNRVVYRLGDTLVLKVAPTCDCGYDAEDVDAAWCECDLSYKRGQNIAESAFWDRIKNDPEHRPYFAEVFGSALDGTWVVAERVTPVSVMPESFHDKMRAIGIYDRNPSNMGKRMSDGHPVMLDYGINEIWEENEGQQYWNNDRDHNEELAEYGDCKCDDCKAARDDDGCGGLDGCDCGCNARTPMSSDSRRDSWWSN